MYWYRIEDLNSGFVGDSSSRIEYANFCLQSITSKGFLPSNHLSPLSLLFREQP